MHILLIHQAFAALDEPGGTRHHELASYIAERGHRITVIASSVSYLTGVANGVRVPWVKRLDGGEGVTILRAYTYPALHRSFVHRVISFISFMFSSFVIGLGVEKVDVVWGTSPPIFQGLTAWALAKLKRVPFLFEVRDLWPAFAEAMGVLRQPFLIRASQWLEGFLYRQANLLVVNSPGFIEHVLERGGRHVELVPNGADVAMFDPQSNGAEFRHIHGLEGKYLVLYAGAHGMSNNLDILLDAANLLAKELNIKLILIGDGKEKQALIKRAGELGLDNVLFLPPIPKRDIPQAMAAADACIAILKPIEMYKTVYPNKVFDYMAAGRPVILAIDGVIREVVEDAGSGIPVPPGDAEALSIAIRALAADPDRGREMGTRGRHYVEEHFERRKLADQMADLFTKLVEE
jgi:glycosyltransferase involved in cell wall biosynthesis